MIKVTRTKSRMTIVTIKAFGFYANLSFGKSSRKAAPVVKAAPAFTFIPYELNRAASIHANDICARLLGQENVNTTPEAMALWFRYRNDFLRANGVNVE